LRIGFRDWHRPVPVPEADAQRRYDLICEKRITVTVASSETSRL